MHIMLIHQAFASTGDAGGTRHIEIAKFLATKGHKITILTSPVSYLSGKNELPGIYLQKSVQFAPNIQIKYCYTYSGLHKGFIPRLFAFTTFMMSSFIVGVSVPQVDSVWGTSPNLFQAWTAYLCARLKQVRFVLEIRDLWPSFAVAMGVLRNPLLIRMSEMLEKFLYCHADQIIVNSPGFLAHIAKQSGRSADLIPNGADSQMFISQDKGVTFRQEHNLTNQFVILYSGAHGPANDLETALNAAELLLDQPDIIFVFVGSGKDKTKLEIYAAHKNLTNVRFLAPVPKDKIADILAAADAGLAILKDIPVFSTTYPNKVFDFMAAGKPLLCQIDGVIRTVIERHACGVFVKPGNSQDLAEKIMYLRNNPGACVAMGSAGKKAIAEEFNRKKTAEQMEAALSGGRF